MQYNFWNTCFCFYYAAHQPVHQSTTKPSSKTPHARSAEALTAANTGLLLTVAVSYSAQADIAAAARRLAEAVAAGALAPDDITPEAVARSLSTAPTLAEAGPPDLLIRTSNTQRLSNFLLFELAYAELCFEPALWPEFGEEHLVRALVQFAARERRGGGRRLQEKGADAAARL
jgi:undecaprenyl diphosphate synthase